MSLSFGPATGAYTGFEFTESRSLHADNLWRRFSNVFFSAFLCYVGSATPFLGPSDNVIAFS